MGASIELSKKLDNNNNKLKREGKMCGFCVLTEDSKIIVRFFLL
jgi:hypothetical protein